MAQNESNKFWTRDPNVLFKSDYTTLIDKLNLVCKYAIIIFIIICLVGDEPMMLFVPILVIVGTVMIHNKHRRQNTIVEDMPMINTPMINTTTTLYPNQGETNAFGGGGMEQSNHDGNHNGDAARRKACAVFPYKPFERQHNDDSHSAIVAQDTTLTENCTQPTVDNPFMNPLYGTSSLQKEACNVHNDAIDTQVKNSFYDNQYVDPNMPEYLKRNQLGYHSFHTVASTSHPSKQKEFAEYLYGNMDNCKTDNCDCKPY